MLLCIRNLVRLLLSGQQLPRHVAFIMDGNRRFADQLRLERIEGHKHGYDKMKDIIQWCIELGIQYVSVYAFSIDNFNRPVDEVDSLMELARLRFLELLQDADAKQWGAELRVIGDLSHTQPAIQQAAAKLMQGSREQGQTRAVVNICFSYKSSQELQHAAQQLCSGIAQAGLLPCDATPTLLHQLMHTRDCPPVDLLIRTSGEQRLSDFLLWQSSHALLHWEQCLWPEFGYVQLLKALLAWQQAAPHLKQLKAAAQEAIAAVAGLGTAAAAATAATVQQQTIQGTVKQPQVGSSAAQQGQCQPCAGGDGGPDDSLECYHCQVVSTKPGQQQRGQQLLGHRMQCSSSTHQEGDLQSKEQQHQQHHGQLGPCVESNSSDCSEPSSSNSSGSIECSKGGVSHMDANHSSGSSSSNDVDGHGHNRQEQINSSSCRQRVAKYIQQVEEHYASQIQVLAAS